MIRQQQALVYNTLAGGGGVLLWFGGIMVNSLFVTIIGVAVMIDVIMWYNK